MAGFTLPQVNLQPGFNALAQGLQMGQEKRSQNALAAALPGALNNDPTALAQIFKVDPNAGLKVQQYIAAQNENKRKLTAEEFNAMDQKVTQALANTKDDNEAAALWPKLHAYAAQTLGSHPEALAMFQQQFTPEYNPVYRQMALKPQDPFTLGEGQVRFGSNGEQVAAGPPKVHELQNVSPGGALIGPDGKVVYRNPFKPDVPEGPTSSYRDFMMSQSNPEYAKFLAAKGGGGLTVDPETGAVTAGGFKAKPIPAEIGTRMALGTSWASQVPDILASIAEGTTSGLNRAGMATGMGKGAAVARRQASGVDALVRSLTGAGMNLQEARKYASRYEIGADDGTDTQRNKVLQLAQELRTIDDSVSKQYGQPASGAYDNIPKPPNLSDELGKQPAIPNGWSVQEH